MRYSDYPLLLKKLSWVRFLLSPVKSQEQASVAMVDRNTESSLVGGLGLHSGIKNQGYPFWIV